MLEAGDPSLVTFFRSSAKPIQALPLVRLRPDLGDEEIAIACASHLARPEQVNAVRRLLADPILRDLLALYGLPKPGYPEEGIRDAVVRAGGQEMRGFYDKLTNTTEEMPFEECLGLAGLMLVESGNRYAIDLKPSATDEAIAIRRDWLQAR